MKATKALPIAILSLIALFLAGCTTPYGEPNHAGTGALIGGVGGAGLGAALAHHNPAAGAVFGGALGAISGAIIGHSMDEPPRPVYAAAPPPPPPAPHYVWVGDQWVWNGREWVWSPGHWAMVP